MLVSVCKGEENKGMGAVSVVPHAFFTTFSN